MRADDDAVTFTGYEFLAADNGDVQLTCIHCPGRPWRVEASSTALLGIVETVRTHNRICPGRNERPAPFSSWSPQPWELGGE